MQGGIAPYPLWSTGNTSDGGDPNSPYFVPAECDTTLQEQDQWFYNPSVGIRCAFLFYYYYFTFPRTTKSLFMYFLLLISV
jgi:hypothetical protein